MDNNNIISAMLEDGTRDNEHTFYDVFDEYTDEYITEYKRMAGIPLTGQKIII